MQYHIEEWQFVSTHYIKMVVGVAVASHAPCWVAVQQFSMPHREQTSSLLSDKVPCWWNLQQQKEYSQGMKQIP